MVDYWTLCKLNSRRHKILWRSGNRWARETSDDRTMLKTDKMLWRRVFVCRSIQLLLLLLLNWWSIIHQLAHSVVYAVTPNSRASRCAIKDATNGALHDWQRARMILGYFCTSYRRLLVDQVRTLFRIWSKPLVIINDFLQVSWQ